MDFQVRFDMPRHGWMGIHFYYDSEHLRIDVSYITSDGLEQLMRCLGNVLAAKPAGFGWMIEPQIIQFEFKSEKDTSIFQVNDHQYEKVKMHFEVEMPSFELVMAFWRSLRCLQSQILIDEFREGWHSAFPDAELAKLTEQLREVKKKQK